MARKGETVHLRCEADGDQPMDVTWKAKGSRIESDYELRYVAFLFHRHVQWSVLPPHDRFHFINVFTPTDKFHPK
jgi:hypothetical protein